MTGELDARLRRIRYAKFRLFLLGRVTLTNLFPSETASHTKLGCN